VDDEIIDVLYSYFKNNKDIDSVFINKLANLAIKYYCLDEYIQNVVFDDSTSLSIMPQASFYFETKEIYFYNKSIMNAFNNFSSQLNKTYDSNMFKYLFVLNVLLHEIEHGNQQRKINTVNDIESEILRAEYQTRIEALKKNKLKKMLLAFKLQRIAQEYYMFAPSERFAENFSCQKVQAIAKKIGDEISYHIMEYIRLDNILRGYNIELTSNSSNAPTKTYLKKINPNFNYSNIENLSYNIKKEDMIKLGLETPRDELNKISKKRLVLSKRIMN